MMKVLRKNEIEVNNINEIKIGDQITIQLTEYGDFTATVQTITDRGPLFMFDQYVISRPMNLTSTNEGGFKNSDLRKWMNDELLPLFPESMQGKIKNLTIPTYGQIFGHDNLYSGVVEPDDTDRFPLMIKRKNRIADFNNDNWSNFLKRFEPGWLQNRILPELPGLIQTSFSKKGKSHFAVITSTGEVSSLDATNAAGVRPVFIYNL